MPRDFGRCFDADRAASAGFEPMKRHALLANRTVALCVSALAALSLASGCTVGRSVLGGPTNDDGGSMMEAQVAADAADASMVPDARPGCTSDTQCRADQFCDTRTGQCAPGCSRDEACTGDSPHCNLPTHTCGPS